MIAQMSELVDKDFQGSIVSMLNDAEKNITNEKKP